MPWQHELETQIENIKDEFAKRDCPIIPVILPGCVNVPKLPAFLRLMTWVDFRQLEPDPLKQLIWGSTGNRERYGVL